MIGAHQSEQRWKGLPLIGGRWLAAIAVLGILLQFLPVQLLSAAIQRVPITQFLLILMGYLLAHTAGVVKWRMMVNAAGARLDYATSAQCYTGGLFATLFLPSIIGGDVVRLALGLRRSPNPAAVLAGNVADRFLDMSAQAGLVLLGVFLLPGAVPVGLRSQARDAVYWFAGIATVVIVLLVLLYRPLLRGRSVRFRRWLARLRSALRSVSRRPGILLIGWILATAIQTTFLALTALVASFCGLFLSLRDWLFAWPLAKLAALLPLTQGGIGIREAALVGLLSPFGAAPYLVLASGLVWDGVVIVGGLMAGIVAFLLGRRKVAPQTL